VEVETGKYSIEKKTEKKPNYTLQRALNLCFWSFPSSKTLKNTIFQRLDLFPSSGDRVREAYFAWSVRKSWPQSLDNWSPVPAEFTVS
jgi:hypothetical protein